MGSGAYIWGKSDIEVALDRGVTVPRAAQRAPFKPHVGYPGETCLDGKRRGLNRRPADYELTLKPSTVFSGFCFHTLRKLPEAKSRQNTRRTNGVATSVATVQMSWANC
jgi:hypothetical protein